MTRPDGTYPYETLIRHLPEGVAISHRTLTSVGGKEYIGDPLPLTGEGVTALNDPALQALAGLFNSVAADAVQDRADLVGQVETLTTERDAALAAVAARDATIAELTAQRDALGTTEQAHAIRQAAEIARLESRILQDKARLADLKKPKNATPQR